MTILRCARCRIVVLDSNEDGGKEVQCVECGTKYKIKLEDGEVVSNIRINQTAKPEEV